MSKIRDWFIHLLGGVSKDEYEELKQRNSELQFWLSKTVPDITTLRQNIVKVDGIPDEYINQQICNKFAKELLPYIEFTKQVVEEPLFCKQETNVCATLKVVKPNE